jgi:peptide/nickel transport system substrate-binding protein
LTALLGSGVTSYRRSFGPVDKGVDELLTRGRQEAGTGSSIDIVKRRAIYSELSRVCASEVPALPFAYRTQAYAQRKNVKGFQALPGFLLSSSGACLEEAYLG